MKTYTFLVKEHENFGGLGFAPSWYPNGDPLGGLGVAHDILEHFPKDEGEAEGEFMALGCMYRLRGETGYMLRKGTRVTIEKILSTDFPEIFRLTDEQRGHTRIKPCPKKVRIDPDVREIFSKIVWEGRRLLLVEFKSRLMHREDMGKIVDWMAYGYQKAGSRYETPNLRKRGVDFYSLAFTLFKNIEEESDRLLKHAEEGMILTVQVNLRQLESRVYLDYPEFD